MSKNYKRVLLKLSGAAFKKDDQIIAPEKVKEYAKQIKKLVDANVQVTVVIGGGNIWRGVTGVSLGMERAQGDYMGMIATIMNSLALQSFLESIGCNSRVQTALNMPKIAEPFIKRRATRHLEKGRVVIFGGGTGSPFFTTDTAAALRATEIDAEVILVAKNGVDGVYNKDPNKHKDAKKFETITYKKVINEELKIMDSTATTLCWENSVDLIVFDIDEEDSIYKAVMGTINHTLITREKK